MEQKELKLVELKRLLHRQIPDEERFAILGTLLDEYRSFNSEFTRQNRGGKGVKCYKITEKTGNVIGVKAVNSENEIMMLSLIHI